MNVGNLSTWIGLLTGGGLLGAAVKIGAAVRDFRAGFEALQELVHLHVTNHPGTAEQENANVGA